MSGLRDIQLRFSDHLFGQQSRELEHLINSNGLSVERRLQIYHNNVFISLMDTLQTLYPVVEKLVGEEYFGQIAHRYVEEHPSRSGNILEYGEHFSEFLRNVPDLDKLPYLPEIAQLEWGLHRIFHAADAMPLEPSSLVDVDPESYSLLKFGPHPATNLVKSEYPLFDIWQLATGQSERKQVELGEGPDWLLLIRRNLEPQLVRLSEVEFLLLSCLAESNTLGVAWEQASRKGLDPDLQTALARLFQLGALSSYSL